MTPDFNHLSLPEPQSIEASSLSKEDFHKRILSEFKPVVIRGLAKNWELVLKQKDVNFNSLDYIRNAVADTKLSLTKVDKTQQSRMFYNDDMTAMNFGVAKVAAASCFDYLKNQLGEADYAVQCVPVNQHFPSLLPTFSNPLLGDDVTPFAWIGNKIIVAPHFDEAHNIAVVAVGKRRFTLFPPEQTKNLYIGPLDNTPAGQPISLVNILQPDLQAHPKYAEAYKHGLSVELEPGDAIFIPTPWWHHVQSLSDFNVLINYWWTESAVASPMPFPMLMHAIQSLKPMQGAQKEAWKAIMMHYVFNDVDPSEHLPDHAKGVLGKLNPKQMRELNMWIKSQIN